MELIEITPFMKSTKSTKVVNKALAKAKSEMKPIVKNKVNTYHKSKYADYGPILQETLRVFRANGLDLEQNVSGTLSGNTVAIETLITHLESGEARYYLCYLPIAKAEPQGAGSGFTYGKRYHLSAIMAIDAEEDDDGNAAQNLGKASSVNKEQLAKTYNATALADVSPQSGLHPFDEQVLRAKEFLRNTFKGDIGTYVINFGKKYKDQAINKIPLNDLVGYADYMRKSSIDGNKSHDNTISFVAAYQLYKEGMSTASAPNPTTVKKPVQEMAPGVPDFDFSDIPPPTDLDRIPF